MYFEGYISTREPITVRFRNDASGVSIYKENVHKMTKISKFWPTYEIPYESRICHRLLGIVLFFSYVNSVFKNQGPANLPSSSRCFAGQFIKKWPIFRSTFSKEKRCTNFIYPFRDHLIAYFRRASCLSSIPITIFRRNNNSGC